MLRLSFALFSLLALLSLVWGADFSGTYKAKADGEDYSLTLVQRSADLGGTAKGGGATYKLKGRAEGNRASGSMTVEGLPVTLSFKAELDGSNLKLSVATPGENGKPDWSDADVFYFTRVSDPKPEAAPGRGREAEPDQRATETLRNGKEYVHASGGKFKYPAAWSLKELEEGMQLLPPDAGEDEIYLVLADGANGETNPASKAVIDGVDQQVRSSIPFVKRVGEVGVANAGNGKGALVVWEGSKDGTLYQVRGYLTILKGYGVALVAFGPKDRIAKRDKVLREIFFTFGWGQGKVEQSLVGAWTHWSYKGSNGYGRETSATVVLLANGTFSYRTSSETAISATTGSMASKRGSGWSGTWTADGSTLILNFEDGSSETFSYRWKRETNGNVTLITSDSTGKNAMEWQRQQASSLE